MEGSKIFGDHFYHAILRKSVAVFGTLFNNIYVVRRASDNRVVDKQRVPLSYGPRQKFLARIDQQADLSDPKVAIKLPRMSFEITNLAYDSTTKTNTLNKITTTSDTSTRTSVSQVTPYIVDMQLNIMAKNQDDALQIMEQILPTFQPVYNISVKLIDDINKSFDVPITLQSVSLNDDYEGDYTTRRVLIYTLDFSMKIKFFGDTSKSGIITQVIANMFEQGGTEHYVTEYVEPFDSTKNYKTAKASANLTNGVVTSVTIDEGGSGYRAPPRVVFSQSLTNTTPTVRNNIVNGEITSASLLTNGFGYESVPNIVISDPETPLAVIGEVTINEDGKLNSIGIAQESTTYQGYVVVPTVTISAPTGTQAEISLIGSSLKSGGNIVFFTPRGLGYDDSVIISAPGEGTDVATITASTNDAGQIVSINITPGQDYDNDTYYPLTIEAPNDLQTGTATATIDTQTGQVDSLSLDTAGKGYDSKPTITIPPEDTDNYTTATATCTIDDTTKVTSITITDPGLGYFSLRPPTFTFDQPSADTRALGTAVIANGVVTSINIDQAGFGYETAPLISIEAPSPTRVIGDNEALLTYSFVNPGSEFTIYTENIPQNPNSFFTVGERVYGANTGSEGEVISCVYVSIEQRVITVINYITGYFEIGENLVGETSAVSHEVSSYVVG